MTLEVFPFMKHSYQIAWPDSSSRMQFGKGYTFAAKPNAPDQLQFTLHFPVMFVYATPDGTIDLNTNPELNMGLLVDFYERHRLYEKFVYDSAYKGPVTVRFANPLSFKMDPKGGGAVEAFQIELVTQP